MCYPLLISLDLGGFLEVFRDWAFSKIHLFSNPDPVSRLRMDDEEDLMNVTDSDELNCMPRCTFTAYRVFKNCVVDWVPEHDPKNDKLTSAWSTLQKLRGSANCTIKSETHFCADSRTKSALNEILTTSCFPSQNTLNTKSLDHNCLEFYGADSDSKKDPKFFEIRVLGINLYLIF